MNTYMRHCHIKGVLYLSRPIINLFSNSSKLLSSSLSMMPKEAANKYIPRRAVLYVPGNDERKLLKIPQLQADCIVMDCEDGVALNKKDEARNTIHKILQKPELFVNKDCSVRVNGVGTDLFEDDLQKVLRGPHLPTTLLIPKVESPEHISKFSDKLKTIVKSHQLSLQDLRLIIYVESAQSLLSLKTICEEALAMSKSAPFILDGVVFGSDDFCADIGATRTSGAQELLFARQWTLTVAKAFHLQAIDVVYIDYKDLEGLKRQSEEGAQFGFTGKQVIHPSQIEAVQKAFSPSKEKIEWAQCLVKAFEEHQSEGKGAFTYRGSMIDKPLLLQAENILKISKHILKDV